MSLNSIDGWRVDVREVDLGNGLVIVANSKELAKFPLARRNNSTTTISTMIPTCIDAPDRALSNATNKIIDLPEFRAF
jgi:hypothetical protein